MTLRDAPLDQRRKEAAGHLEATGSTRLAEASYAPAGTYLFRAGGPLSQVYVIRRGLVALSQTFPDRRVIQRLLGPGDVAGDVPLLRGVPAPFDAVALSDVAFTALSAPRFLWALENEPEFARRTMRSLAEHVSGWQQRVAELLSGDLRTQVASLLVHELGDRPNVRLTQQWLADLVGARRTSINRVLRQLAREGLVDLGYRRVEVLDRPGLAAVAGGADLEVEARSAGLAGAVARAGRREPAQGISRRPGVIAPPASLEGAARGDDGEGNPGGVRHLREGVDPNDGRQLPLIDPEPRP